MLQNINYHLLHIHKVIFLRKIKYSNILNQSKCHSNILMWLRKLLYTKFIVFYILQMLKSYLNIPYLTYKKFNCIYLVSKINKWKIISFLLVFLNYSNILNLSCNLKNNYFKLYYTLYSLLCYPIFG